MRKILLVICLFTSQIILAQYEFKGVKIPSEINTNEVNLALKGAGVRTFLWMNMYVGGIYLEESQNITQQLIEKDEDMALRLQIMSSLVSNKRIIESLEEGFAKGAENGLESLQSRIDQLVGFFDKEIKPGDSIELIYKKSSQSFTYVYNNGNLLGKIEGFDFKKALFGIWISDDPADEKMKQQLLSGI